jgi:asparagine synthase (glutamine-hydrolysing)
MSAIAGALRLDDGLADASAVRAMIAAMPHRGAPRTWADGPLVFGSCQWSIDAPNPPDDARPTQSRDARTWLVGDARLDDRAIAASCGLPPGAVDAEVLCEVLARPSLDLLPFVLGEFALAAWQPAARRLVLARDALGLRSLYWARQGSYVWWASELQAMLAVPWYSARPCEAFIGELLAGFPVDLGSTVFAGIERLPPAHVLVADARGVRCSPYWSPPAFARDDLSDTDHADRLEAVLLEAVRCRISGDPARTGFDLSGGLDSSSVVALARDNWPADLPLRTYSLIFPGLPAADEQSYIDAMVRHVGAASQTIDPRGATRDAYLAHVVRYRDFPDVAHGEPLRAALVGVAKADGLRVLLTGAGGDLWLGGNIFTLAMLARRGRWGRLVREVRGNRPDVPWRQLLSATILPNLPIAVKKAVRTWVNRVKRPAWIPKAFADRIDLVDRMRAGGLRGTGATPVIQESVARFWSGELAYAADRVARTAAWHGFDLRHPFLDRRVVETVMTLPDDQRCVDGLTKVVLRRAMGSRLPALVRNRRSKADNTDLMLPAVECLEPDRLLTDLQVARAGWVDGRIVVDLLRAMRRGQHAGAPDYDAIAALWRVCSAEVWLRHEQGLDSRAV